MKNLFLFLTLILSVQLKAETKLSAEMVIDDLQFQRPIKGVGRAGTLIFKSANVNNNGIILNLTNVNKFFDSQIFLRPTFLGFTTQFGNYGFTLEENNMLTSIQTMQLQTSNFILDDNQLNLSGEHLKFVNADTDVMLKKFRLYCQSSVNSDLVTSCLNYLTLNGTNTAENVYATLDYKGVNLKTGDKTALLAKVRTVDIRKTNLSMTMANLKSISNDSYIISADTVNLKCAKDPSLTTFDTDKLTKDCLNNLKIAPLKASLVDNVAKSTFNLDVRDIAVEKKIVYLALNSGTLSDAVSTTFISDLLVNCRKETDTDLLELNQVIKDCITYTRINIGEVKSSRPDDNKGSSIKKIAVNSDGGKMLIQADVKIIGFTSRVSIYAMGAFNDATGKLTLTVTDTKLPLGFTSVKLLMYFLKKNLISKDVTYQNNNIIISL
jgi:hypothetical protein